MSRKLSEHPTSIKTRRHYEKHKEKVKLKHAEHRKSKSWRASHILGSVKKRAVKYGMKFELDHEWMKERLEKGVCEATGLPLNFKNFGPRWPSIDRKDSDGDYTKENCWVVCLQYNLAKNRWGEDDLRELCYAVITKR